MDNLMLTQRPWHTIMEYVYLMRQSFDNYNETYEMIDGSATIHPHNLGLLTLPSTSSSGHYEQCAINAFVTNYLLSPDEIMTIIMLLAQSMEEKIPLTAHPEAVPPHFAAPSASAFVADGRGQPRGCPSGFRDGDGRRGPLPNKCSECGGGLYHIMSSCGASDDALLKWTLAKRKVIV
jgi:hypothetical protein